MSAPWYLVRFFLVVPPISRMMISTFVVLAIAASVEIVADGSNAPNALMPVVVLQLFAASTGFAMPARRGYYDLLLTRGSGRLGIAVTHWLASILPGLVTWFVVCVTEAIATGGRAGAARASGTVAAFVLVSTLPWAITVRLPRFTGAVGWLLLAVATVAFAPASAASWTGWNRQLPGSVAPPTAGSVLFPVALIGRDIGLFPAVVVPSIVLAGASVAIALLWIQQTDFPLEASQ